MLPDTDKSAIPFVTRVLGLQREELPAVAWSFVYFFCLLAAYYMLRSVREAMAIVGGTENIPWLFTGTFVAMIVATTLFGWVASRYPRRVFLPWVYYFFVANILLFFGLFTAYLEAGRDPVWLARAFFVWLSVFNLFVVSVFWSFMADIYGREQGRRLFGVISAGGSIGALLGPLVTSVLVVRIGFQNLLPLSALLLLFSVFCIYRLRRWSRQRGTGSVPATEHGKPLGGSALDGARFVGRTPYFLAISIALVLANFMGVVTYMYMAELVSVTFADTDRHTQVFALMDAATNALSFIGQLLVVRWAVRGLGIGMTLAVLPVVSVAGFALLAANPVFMVVAVLQVLRRSITFGLSKPTNDMLYSVVSREAKYKAKNFIETVIYRAGDLVSAWTVRLLSGLGLSGVALVCVPLALAWTAIALWLGREYRRLDAASPEGPAVSYTRRPA